MLYCLFFPLTFPSLFLLTVPLLLAVDRTTWHQKSRTKKNNKKAKAISKFCDLLSIHRAALKSPTFWSILWVYIEIHRNTFVTIMHCQGFSDMFIISFLQLDESNRIFLGFLMIFKIRNKNCRAFLTRNISYVER